MFDVCVRFSVFVLFCVQVEALRQADHPSKGPTSVNDQETKKSTLCSEMGAKQNKQQTNSLAFSLQANYTDRATAAG
jgi:hypothetical protein